MECYYLEIKPMILITPLGTKYYLSPDILLKKYNRIGSGIFSLDEDLFTLITYRMPFLNAKK